MGRLQFINESQTHHIFKTCNPAEVTRSSVLPQWNHALKVIFAVEMLSLNALAKKVNVLHGNSHL